jgi:hypothetical protein
MLLSLKSPVHLQLPQLQPPQARAREESSFSKVVPIQRAAMTNTKAKRTEAKEKMRKYKKTTIQVEVRAGAMR